MSKPLPFIPENAPFNAGQRAWINGFLAGLFSDANGGSNGAAISSLAGVMSEPAGLSSNVKASLLILFGSQTGTAEALARRIGEEASRKNFAPRILDMNAFASVAWENESRLLIVTSTWGDGEPPDNAAGFWNFLNSKNAPPLSHLHYSVLALGDRNYSDFCGAGRKFDDRLAQLGARRVHPRADNDVDYEATANAWMDGIWPALQMIPPLSETAKANDEKGAPEVLVETKANSPSPALFDRKNPYPARLLANRKLNAPGSEKDTRHFEISLEGSGLTYEVGDALGVFPKNSSALVDEILTALNCDGEEAVEADAGTPLRKALLEHFEIRQIPSGLVQALAERSGDISFREISGHKATLEKFLHGREIIDLLLAYPQAKFAPDEFVSLLRKLNPRLYSISSSAKAHPGEVHLTVAVVRYESHGRQRQGVCSTFLADRADAQTPVPIFVQPSHGFRLPPNGDKPIIMIGPGTGIAPFRAFLEERRAVGARGKNWLFFGDQRRDCDFLYREELEAMQRDGSLHRLDTAFSRDQAGKIYVQNRLLENAREVWSWLEEGSHLYICGDAKRMAKDVDAALHQIVQTAGKRNAEQAAEYMQRLKTEKRYQRDVY